METLQYRCKDTKVSRYYHDFSGIFIVADMARTKEIEFEGVRVYKCQ